MAAELGPQDEMVLSRKFVRYTTVVVVSRALGVLPPTLQRRTVHFTLALAGPAKSSEKPCSYFNDCWHPQHRSPHCSNTTASPPSRQRHARKRNADAFLARRRSPHAQAVGRPWTIVHSKTPRYQDDGLRARFAGVPGGWLEAASLPSLRALENIWIIFWVKMLGYYLENPTDISRRDDKPGRESGDQPIDALYPEADNVDQQPCIFQPILGQTNVLGCKRKALRRIALRNIFSYSHHLELTMAQWTREIAK
ncbi:hypothetical protein K504DRAFT_505398 [Pleomassaria siparia CBS 279.74]|uniref:Uncharacterized protein n=1 Tax=Pleomassaria siparia CBS 279.74 TaxID=1314801 RepID=A0A6G1K140_9PLEO|nr:hypothetical protein K504DRAFT_505398 [Pleomassaria siparia CBS 279.74]